MVAPTRPTRRGHVAAFAARTGMSTSAFGHGTCMSTTMPRTTTPPTILRTGTGKRLRRVAIVANTEKIRKRDRRDLDAALRDVVEHVSWLTIEKGSAAKSAAKRAKRDGCDLVVVAGGD